MLSLGLLFHVVISQEARGCFLSAQSLGEGVGKGDRHGVRLKGLLGKVTDHYAGSCTSPKGGARRNHPQDVHAHGGEVPVPPASPRRASVSPGPG